QRGRTAGDNALHHLGIGSESGRTLARIEYTEPAGRACTEVEQPSTLPEGGFGERDRPGDAKALRMNRVGDARVLAVDQVHDLERARQVDLGAAWIAALGDSGIQDG